MFFFLLNFFVFSSETNTYIIRNRWTGNWTLHVYNAPNSTTHHSSHLRDYYATVQKITSRVFDVFLYESREDVTPFKKLNFDIHSMSYIMKDEDEVVSFSVVSEFSRFIHTSGIFKNFRFDFILSTKYRYDMNLFDKNTNQWYIVTMLKDVERHEETWWEENFYLIIGGSTVMILMFIFYQVTFKKIILNAEIKEQIEEEAKKQPKPEFVDVLNNDTVVRRDTHSKKEITD